jgi:hypothetical protein
MSHKQKGHAKVWRAPDGVSMALISAFVTDERGNPLCEPIDFRSTLLPGIDDLRFTLLRFVDPYGDTIFSCSQISTLQSDLRVLKESTPGEEYKILFQQLEALCEMCLDAPHRYLKFVGD